MYLEASISPCRYDGTVALMPCCAPVCVTYPAFGYNDGFAVTNLAH